MIHSLGYWNDFLVPTLFRCQVDLCCAVSPMYLVFMFSVFEV